MTRLLFALLALASLAGCATKEGIALPTSRPTQDDVGDFSRRNTPSSSSTGPTAPLAREVVKSSLIPDVSGPRLIVVGNAMALTVFDEATLSQRYENYLKQLGAKTATILSRMVSGDQRGPDFGGILWSHGHLHPFL